MKRYVCITDCYVEGRLYRARSAEASEWIVEDDFTHPALSHFSLQETFDSPAKPKKATSEDLFKGAKSFARQNKITPKKMDEITKAAGAKEPHEVMKALADFVSSQKED